MTSLFTNILRELDLNCIRKRWHEIEEFIPLNLAEFIEGSWSLAQITHQWAQLLVMEELENVMIGLCIDLNIN